jgi:hypothetical protein
MTHSIEGNPSAAAAYNEAGSITGNTIWWNTPPQTSSSLETEFRMSQFVVWSQTPQGQCGLHNDTKVCLGKWLQPGCIWRYKDKWDIEKSFPCADDSATFAQSCLMFASTRNVYLQNGICASNTLLIPSSSIRVGFDDWFVINLSNDISNHTNGTIWFNRGGIARPMWTAPGLSALNPRPRLVDIPGATDAGEVGQVFHFAFWLNSKPNTDRVVATTLPDEYAVARRSPDLIMGSDSALSPTISTSQVRAYSDPSSIRFSATWSATNDVAMDWATYDFYASSTTCSVGSVVTGGSWTPIGSTTVDEVFVGQIYANIFFNVSSGLSAAGIPATSAPICIAIELRWGIAATKRIAAYQIVANPTVTAASVAYIPTTSAEFFIYGTNFDTRAAATRNIDVSASAPTVTITLASDSSNVAVSTQVINSTTIRVTPISANFPAGIFNVAVTSFGVQATKSNYARFLARPTITSATDNILQEPNTTFSVFGTGFIPDPNQNQNAIALTLGQAGAVPPIVTVESASDTMLIVKIVSPGNNTQQSIASAIVTVYGAMSSTSTVVGLASIPPASAPTAPVAPVPLAPPVAAPATPPSSAPMAAPVSVPTAVPVAEPVSIPNLPPPVASSGSVPISNSNSNSVPTASGGGSGDNTVGIAVGVSIAVLVLIAAILVAIFIRRRRKKRSGDGKQAQLTATKPNTEKKDVWESESSKSSESDSEASQSEAETHYLPTPAPEFNRVTFDASAYEKWAIPFSELSLKKEVGRGR